MALILSFKDKETESFYHSGKSKVFLQEIQKRALLKLDTLSYATNIKDLKAPPSNHLEKLSGNLQGFYNIRINVKYRCLPYNQIFKASVLTLLCKFLHDGFS